MENITPIEPVEVNENVNEPVEQEVAEHVEETYKAWKQPAEPSEEEVGRIPYSRFKAANDEKKAAEARADQIEAELRKYRARDEELARIKTPDDIKIGDYTDPDKYLADLVKATKEQAIKEVEERSNARQIQALREAKLNDIANNYTKTMNEAFDRNPEIKEASTFLDKQAEAGRVNADIAYELMIDENAGELIYDICTDQGLLDELLSIGPRGNPTDFLRKLHKMSARIDRDSRYAKADGDDHSNVPVKALDPKSSIKAGIPSQVRGGTGNVTKDPSKMTNEQYKAWRKAGGGR